MFLHDFAASAILLMTGTDAGECRPVFKRKNRHHFIEVVDQFAIMIEKLVQVGFLESFHTGLKDEFGVFPADIDGIVLDASRLPDILERPVFGYKSLLSKQALF